MAVAYADLDLQAVVCPHWFTLAGSLISTWENPFDRNGRCLYFRTLGEDPKRNVSLQIGKYPDGLIMVAWTVRAGSMVVTGHIRADRSLVTRIFDLSEGVRSATAGRTTFANRYLCDDGQEDLFVRRGPHLNLPCPGIGSLGDPNLSVFLSPSVKTAIRTYLEASQASEP